MKPDQLSAADLPRDATLNEFRKLALKAHLEESFFLMDLMLTEIECSFGWVIRPSTRR